jgi:surface antigen
MEGAFWGKSGRDAKNWPNSEFIGGDWTDTNSAPLPVSKRKPGMLAVWKGGTHGHVAFVEEVSSDLSQYRVSEFNIIALSYRTKWYSYEGTGDCGLYSGSGCPYFYQLPLPSGSSQTSGTATLMNRDGGPPIHPPGSLLRTALNPTVYLIDSEGRKRGIASLGVLSQLYNQGTDFRTDTNFTSWVITVSQSALDQYETGGVLNAALPSNGREGSGGFPDGKLIRNQSNGEISIVTGGGRRRPFAALSTLTGLGFNPNMAVNVDSGTYGSYSAGAPVDAMALLTTGISLTPTDPYTIGQSVTGRFSVKNVGYSSFTFSSLVLGGRVNGACCTDMTNRPTTLTPGQVYNYDGSGSLSSAANWDLFVAFQETNGHWTEFVPAASGVVRRRQVAVSNSTPISVTVTTSPSNQLIVVDNIQYTAPKTFSWIAGQSHSISVPTPQENAGTRRVFTGWNGGSTANPRTVSPSGSITYTANFQTQHFLSTTPNPSQGGSVSPAGNWYPAGQNVVLTATANNGFSFATWSGPVAPATGISPADTTSVTVNGPLYVGANFSEASAPLPPGANAASNVTSAGFTANWSASSGASGYKLDVSTVSNFSSFVTGYNNLDVGTATSRLVTGLSPGTTYFYRLRSYNTIGTSQNSGTVTVITATLTGAGPLFDFDGDRKTDVSIYRTTNPSFAEWWWRRSSDGQGSAVVFGTSTDVLAPADFTGDGKTDVAIFRRSTGSWFILRSENQTFYGFPFGLNNDVPAPADYDGDSRADVAVFRPSAGLWFIQRSSDGQTAIVPFGSSGDLPVTADYDGDGRSDFAVFRRNGGQGAEWWISRSSLGLMVVTFGSPPDFAVPGDYTGDGKADVAFFRPSNGNWFILRSEDLSFFAFPFGTTGDFPSPGDYDGDGRVDVTVFRPSTATWFINRSSAGVLITPFGSSGDISVPNAYVR